MKKLRGILCALLIISFVTSFVSAAVVEYGAENNPNQKEYSQTFSDIPLTHWAFQYIAELVERKAISGYPDGKFYPDNTVTRQEFAKIMVVAAGLTPTPVKTASYADVPITHWASPFVEAASGYMTAYRNSATREVNFKPTAGALREDIAVAVVKLRGYDTRLADLSLLDTMFSDVEAISAAARPYVALAVENGIISGYSDGTFRAQNTIARSEAAAILWRAFQYGSDEKVVGDGTTGVVTPTTPPTPTTTPKTEVEKPYLVDSLVSAKIMDVDLFMTMDAADNLIYYDAGQNQIIKLDTAAKSTETLLDVGDAVYAHEGIIYTGLTVRQVFWDNVGSRLLVDGEFKTVKKDGSDDGWEDAEGATKTYRAIFTLKGGALAFFAEIPKVIGEHEAILCALDNGNFIVSHVSHNTYYRIFDFEENSEVADISHNSVSNWFEKLDGITQIGRDIYARCYGELQQYDYSTGKWKTVSEIPMLSTSDYGGIHYQNGAFYTWLPAEIRATRPNGQKKSILNPSTDIEVLDLLKLPGKPDNLFVTQDEHFLFYDDAGKAIRMIYPNPSPNTFPPNSTPDSSDVAA